MGAQQERVVLAFLRAFEGVTMDVEAMCALMSEDFVWQINVPLAPVVVGREAARAEIERQNTVSTGMLPGSEVRSIASTENTVFTERIDVVRIAGKTIPFHINGVFEIRDGEICAWREYFDSADAALRLGIDPNLFYVGIGASGR
jgi:limonene-1,2-epoxide hydrolase